MYKISVTAVALVFSLAASNLVSAAENQSKSKVYISGAAGWAIPNSIDGTDSGVAYTIDYENGPFFSGALGYKVNKNFRIEAEASYTSVGADSITGNGVSIDLSADIDLLSFTANAFFDIPTKSGFTPYLGGGAGIVRWDTGTITATLNGTSVSAAGDSGSDLTAFGEVGVAFSLSDNVDLVPAYRYQWFDNSTSTEDADSAHIFKLGLRIGF